MTPLFSIVTPTRDRAHLLPRAIRSALKQTLPDFELIIVDDGSVDDTAEVVASFQDERIVYLKQETPQGVSAARNVGIRRAKGQYVAFLDSDDEYLPEFLARMHQLFETTPSDVGFAWSGFRSVMDYPDREQVLSEFVFPAHEYRTRRQSQLHLLRHPPGAPYLTVKTHCFEQIGLFDEQLQSAEDFDLVVRLSQHYDYRALSEVLVAVHQHSGPHLSSPGLTVGKAFGIVADKHGQFLRLYPPRLVALHTRAAILYYQAGDKSAGRRHILRALRLSPLRWGDGWRILLYFELFGPPLPPGWRQLAAVIMRLGRRFGQRAAVSPQGTAADESPPI